MAVGKHELTMVLNAIDNASSNVKAVGTSIGQLTQTINQSNAAFKSYQATATASLAAVTQAMNRLNAANAAARQAAAQQQAQANSQRSITQVVTAFNRAANEGVAVMYSMSAAANNASSAFAALGQVLTGGVRAVGNAAISFLQLAQNINTSIQLMGSMVGSIVNAFAPPFGTVISMATSMVTIVTGAFLSLSQVVVAVWREIGVAVVNGATAAAQGIIWLAGLAGQGALAAFGALWAIVKELGGSLGGMVANILGVGNAFNQATNDGSLFSQMLRDNVVAGAAFAATLYLIQQAAEGLKEVGRIAYEAAFSFNALQERAVTAFTAMMGGTAAAKQEAEGFLATIKQFAEQTPFEVPSLITAAQKFMAVGVSAQNVLPILRNLAGAMAAMGGDVKNIDGVVEALVQMQRSGKVNAQDMNQLANRGIAAWTVLTEYIQANASKFGMNISKNFAEAQAQVRALAENGKISANDMLNALDYAFKNKRWDMLFENLGKSWEVVTSNIRDKIRNMAGDIFKPLFEAATIVAFEVQNALGSDMVQQIAANLAATMQEIASILAPLGERIKSIFVAVNEGFKAGGIAGALDAAKNEFVKFGKDLFGAGFTAVQEFANGMLQGVQSIIRGAANAVADMIARFLVGHSPPPEGPLSTIDQAGKQLVETYLAGMGQASMESVKNVAKNITNALTGQSMSVNIGDFISQIKASATDSEKLKQIVESIEDAQRGVAAEQTTVNAALRDAQYVVQTIKDEYEDYINSIQRGIDAINEQNALYYKQTELLDRLTEIELQRQKLALQGNPAQIGAIDAEIDMLQEREKALSMREKERQFDEQQRAHAEAMLNYQRQLFDYEKSRILTLIRGGKVTAQPPKSPSMKDLDAARERFAIEKRIYQLNQQKDKLNNKPAMRELEIRMAIAKHQSDTNRLAKEEWEIRNQIATLPMEEEIKRARKEMQQIIEPLNDYIRGLQHTKQSLDTFAEGLNNARQIAQDLIGDLKRVKEAGRELDLTPEDQQPIGRRIGESLLTGIRDYWNENAPGILGGMIGAQLGGALFGPLGAIAGGIFGANFGTRLNKDLEGDVFGTVQRRISGFLEYLADQASKAAGGFAVIGEGATNSSISTNRALTAVELGLLALNQLLKGDVAGATETFSVAMRSAGQSVDYAVVAIGDLLGLNLSPTESTWTNLGAVVAEAGRQISLTIDWILWQVSNLIGKDPAAEGESKWTRIVNIWNGIWAGLQYIFSKIREGFDALIGFDPNTGGSRWDAFTARIQFLWTKVKELWDGLLQFAAWLSGAQIGKDNWETLGNILDQVKIKGGQAFEWLKEKADGFMKFISDKGTWEQVERIGKTLVDMLVQVGRFFGLGGDKTEAFGNDVRGALNAGKAPAQEFKDVLKEVLDGIEATASALLSLMDITNTFGEVLIRVFRLNFAGWIAAAKQVWYFGQALMAVYDRDWKKAGAAIYSGLTEPFKEVFSDLAGFGEIPALLYGLGKRLEERGTKAISSATPAMSQAAVQQAKDIAKAREAAEAAAKQNQTRAAEGNPLAVDPALIKDAAEMAQSGGVKVAEAAAAGVEQGSPLARSAVDDGLTLAATGIKAHAPEFASAGAMLADAFTQGFSSRFEATTDPTTMQQVEGQGQQFAAKGAAVATSFYTGWSERMTALVSEFDKVISGISEHLGGEGHLKEMAAVGDAYAEALANAFLAGIDQRSGTFDGAASGVAAQMMSASHIAEMATAGVTLADAFADAFNAQMQARLPDVDTQVGQMPAMAANQRPQFEATGNNLAGSMMGSFLDMVERYGGLVGQSVANVGRQVESRKTEYENAGNSIGYSLIKAIIDTISANVSTLGATGAWLVGMLVTGMYKELQRAFGLGESIPEGMAKGMQSGEGQVAQASQALGYAGTDGIADAAKIASPSQVAVEYGEQIIAGLVKGLNAKGEVADVIRIIVEEALKAGVDPLIAVALAQTESSLNPRAVGDNGHSVGLFQMHDKGRGAGMSVEQRQDPRTNAREFFRQTAEDFKKLWASGLRGGALATEYGRVAEKPLEGTEHKYGATFVELVTSIKGLDETLQQLPSFEGRSTAIRSGPSPRGPVRAYTPPGAPGAVVIPGGGTATPPMVMDPRNAPQAPGRGATGAASRYTPDLGQWTTLTEKGKEDLKNSLQAAQAEIKDLEARAAKAAAEGDIDASNAAGKRMQELAALVSQINATIAANANTTAAAIIPAMSAAERFTAFIGGKLVPAGLAAGNSLQQMGVGIDPLIQNMEAGKYTTSQLVRQIAEVASSTGLALQPLEGLRNNTMNAEQAMRAILDAAALTDPAFTKLRDQLVASGASAQEMAAAFLNLVSNIGGNAAAAVGQMAENINAVNVQVQAGTLAGKSLAETLVTMANSSGLTSTAMTELQAGTSSWQNAVAQVIESSKGASVEFFNLWKSLHDGTISVEEAQKQYLALLNTFKATPQAAAAAANAIEQANAAAAAAPKPGEVRIVPRGAANTPKPPQLPPGMTVPRPGTSMTNPPPLIMEGGPLDPRTRGAAAIPPPQVSPGAVTAASAANQQAGQQATAAVATGIQQAIPQIQAALTSMTASLTQIATQLGTLGQQMGAQIAAGVSQGLGALKSAADQAVQYINFIFEAMNRAAEVRSPSKKGKKLGKNIGEGVADGISGTQAAIRARLEAIVKAVTGEFLGASLDAEALGDRVWANQEQILRLSIRIAQEEQKLLPIRQQIADLEEQIARTVAGSVADQIKLLQIETRRQQIELLRLEAQRQIIQEFGPQLAAIEARSVQLNLDIAKAELTRLPILQQIERLKADIEILQKGDLDTQLKVFDMETARLQASLKIAEAQQNIRKAFTDILALEQQLAAQAVKRAQAELAILPTKQRLDRVNANIDKINKGSLADQITEIKRNEQINKNKLRLLQIEEAIGAAQDRNVLEGRALIDANLNRFGLTDYSSTKSGSQVDQLESEKKRLEELNKEMERQAEIERLTRELSTTQLQIQKVILEDQITQHNELHRAEEEITAYLEAQKNLREAQKGLIEAMVIGPLQQEMEILQGEQEIIAITGQLRSRALERELVIREDQLRLIDRSTLGMEQELALLEAQKKVIEATKALREFQLAGPFQQELDLLENEAAMIKLRNELAAAGAKEQLIVLKEQEYQQSRALKQMEKQLEVLNAQKKVYDAINALIAGLLDRETPEEGGGGGGGGGGTKMPELPTVDPKPLEAATKAADQFRIELERLINGNYVLTIDNKIFGLSQQMLDDLRRKLEGLSGEEGATININGEDVVLTAEQVTRLKETIGKLPPGIDIKFDDTTLLRIKDRDIPGLLDQLRQIEQNGGTIFINGQEIDLSKEQVATLITQISQVEANHGTVMIDASQVATASTAVNGLKLDTTTLGDSPGTVTINGQQITVSKEQLQLLALYLQTLGENPGVVNIDGADVTLSAEQVAGLKASLAAMGITPTVIAVDDSQITRLPPIIDGLPDGQITVQADGTQVTTLPAIIESLPDANIGVNVDTTQIDTTYATAAEQHLANFTTVVDPTALVDTVEEGERDHPANFTAAVTVTDLQNAIAEAAADHNLNFDDIVQNADLMGAIREAAQYHNLNFDDIVQRGELDRLIQDAQQRRTLQVDARVNDGGVMSFINGIINRVWPIKFQSNAPGRAKGGPVSSPKAYIVGEQGPELFVPYTNGNIIPNSRTMQMLSSAGYQGRAGGGPVSSGWTPQQEAFLTSTKNAFGQNSWISKLIMEALRTGAMKIGEAGLEIADILKGRLGKTITDQLKKLQDATMRATRMGGDAPAVDGGQITIYNVQAPTEPVAVPATPIWQTPPTLAPTPITVNPVEAPNAPPLTLTPASVVVIPDTTQIQPAITAALAATNAVPHPVIFTAQINVQPLIDAYLEAATVWHPAMFTATINVDALIAAYLEAVNWHPANFIAVTDLQPLIDAYQEAVIWHPANFLAYINVDALIRAYLEAVIWHPTNFIAVVNAEALMRMYADAAVMHPVNFVARIDDNALRNAYVDAAYNQHQVNFVARLDSGNFESQMSNLTRSRTVNVNVVQIGGVQARAAGGDVNPMGMYRVGELGPEMFVPHTDGVILPAHMTKRIMDQLPGRAGGGMVSAPGEMMQSSAQSLIQAFTMVGVIVSRVVEQMVSGIADAKQEAVLLGDTLRYAANQQAAASMRTPQRVVDPSVNTNRATVQNVQHTELNLNYNYMGDRKVSGQTELERVVGDTLRIAGL